MSSVRRAMMAKATFIKEQFPWARAVRLRLSRASEQLHLAAYAVPDLSQVLKERNLEDHTTINIGLTLEQLSNPDQLNFREMRKSRNKKSGQTNSMPGSQASSAAPSRSTSPAPGFLPPSLPPTSAPPASSTPGCNKTKVARGRSTSRTGQTPENKRQASAKGVPRKTSSVESKS